MNSEHENALDGQDSPAARVALFRERIQDLANTAPEAYSADGRTFSFSAPPGAGLQVGSLVTVTTPDGAKYLAQIRELRLDSMPGPEVEIDIAHPEDFGLPNAGRATLQPGIRIAAGEGALLHRLDDPAGTPRGFAVSTVEPASDGDIAAWLDATASRSAVPVGTIPDGPPAPLITSGFSRHTFLAGQSGSGKTYSLGVLIEQLILHTSLPLLVLDPNSDYVRVREARRGDQLTHHPPPTGPGQDLSTLADEYQQRAAPIRVARSVDASDHRTDVLRIRFSDLSPAEQGLVLRLDPVRDEEDYSYLGQLIDRLGDAPYSLLDLVERAAGDLSDSARRLRRRIANLGIASWSLWAGSGESSIADLLDARPRGLVLDTGSLPDPRSRSIVAAAVLGRLWRSRGQRQPVLVVMDEAHNVCPANSDDELEQVGTEHAIRIAGEGRKFGLYLLVCTQRPQKVHPNVVSQCDNLILMRMNSLADVEELTEVFSHVPAGLLREAPGFPLGQALIAGRLTPAPMFIRFGGRISPEGGADVPADWASG